MQEIMAQCRKSYTSIEDSILKIYKDTFLRIALRCSRHAKIGTLVTLVPENPQEFFNFADNFRPLRSNHRFKLKIRAAKLNSYKYSFFIRIINLWNNLSKEIAEAENLRTFKKKLVSQLI